MGRYQNRSDKNRRSRGEHCIVWETANGPIPAGHVIHHIDEDPRNNDIGNLQLMTRAAHSKLHNQRHPLTKACEVCGDTFTPHPTKRKRAKTCSPACRSALLSLKLRGNRNGVGRRQPGAA
jgi:hypothetical protein